ncbi:MAG: twin-arginine translocase TatA/TatE family subunit [Fibromonadales bacterium]|nr:twin-arginine translocase TatA/TatE family subunit [Fibromonadales bacterium]
MGPIGVPELLLILLIVLVLFGAKKIPELAKGLGSGLKEFRKASKELDDTAKSASEVDKETSIDDKNSQ